MPEEKEEASHIKSAWATNLLDNYTEAVEEHVKSDYSSETNDRVIDLRQQILDYLLRVRIRD